MLSTKTIKRFIFLHSLGVPLPGNYSIVFDDISDFIKPEKFFKATAHFEREHVCAMNKWGEVSYATFPFREDDGMGNEVIIEYLMVNNTIRKIYEKHIGNLSNSVELEEIAEEMLRFRKVKFDYFSVSIVSEYDKNSKFWQLRKKYESGDFELLD